MVSFNDFRQTERKNRKDSEESALCQDISHLWLNLRPLDNYVYAELRGSLSQLVSILLSNEADGVVYSVRIVVLKVKVSDLTTKVDAVAKACQAMADKDKLVNWLGRRLVFLSNSLKSIFWFVSEVILDTMTLELGNQVGSIDDVVLDEQYFRLILEKACLIL